MSFQFASISEPDLLNAIGSEFTLMFRELETQGHSIDEVAELLASNTAAQFGIEDTNITPERRLWARLKDEFRNLICTDDQRYAQLRLGLGKESGIASALMLSLISSSISAHLGLEAGLCTPFVALLLISIGRTTQAAWCNDIPPPPAPRFTQHICRLLEIKRGRLQVLEEQAAHYGIATQPHITIEIEDLRAEIAQLLPSCESQNQGRQTTDAT